MRFSCVVATIIAIALFSTIAYANPGDDPGQTIHNPWAHLFTTTPTTEEPTETIPPDGMYDVSQYRPSSDPSTYTHPNQAGKVFAGWFTDSTCSAAKSDNTGLAYAKFVDEKLLTVKFQQKNDRTALRLLSAIDGVDYSEIGFTFSGTYGEGTLGPITDTVDIVYKNIMAAGQTVKPTVFSSDAKYFSIYTLRKINPEKTLILDVIPYWITLDGTKVEGPSKHYPVS